MSSVCYLSKHDVIIAGTNQGDVIFASNDGDKQTQMFKVDSPVLNVTAEEHFGLLFIALLHRNGESNLPVSTLNMSQFDAFLAPEGTNSWLSFRQSEYAPFTQAGDSLCVASAPPYVFTAGSDGVAMKWEISDDMKDCRLVNTMVGAYGPIRSLKIILGPSDNLCLGKLLTGGDNFVLRYWDTEYCKQI